MKKLLISCLLVLSGIGLDLFAQEKKISVSDIWTEYKFLPKRVPGFNFMNDGIHFTKREGSKITQYDIRTGEQTAVIFDLAEISDSEILADWDSYFFSEDESRIIFESEREGIYRRSSKANFFIWDRKNNSIKPVQADGKISYVSLNVTGDKVAFVFENNIYIQDLKNGKTTPVTTDGEVNSIINGSADWVYEEEFSMSKAFAWSPNGEKIAFLRFDERAVPQFTMTNYHDELYPRYYDFKYPKVGEDNASVGVYYYELSSGKTKKISSQEGPNVYYPRIKWTPRGNELAFMELNRHQNHLKIHLVNTETGASKILLEEKDKYYIAESHLDHLHFFDDAKHFIWTSERDGWDHVYLYGMDGELKRQLTKGNYDVTAYYGVDEKNGKIYFQAAMRKPIEREVYSVSIDGGTPECLTTEEGTSRANFSDTYAYFIKTYSSSNSANEYTVCDRTGKTVRELEKNEQIGELQKSYGVQPVEHFSFKTSEGIDLNGYMIKPPNFNENLSYPVFMYVYGGPGSQTVMNSFGGFNYWWFQLLAQNGYIVVSVDNRGTGARGAEFKKMTYLELGKYETIDQIEAAKYLGSLSYTDADRIGIFGWSYGGYMSSNCILKGAEVFKAAIAVAPVTNWKWYDTIYTERYMRTLKENESGYKDNSPIYFAEQLKGAYLLVHGMGDDNVHFQHTAEMANALIAANKQFDTYFYPNRSHGIAGGTTRAHLYTKMTNFIFQNL